MGEKKDKTDLDKDLKELAIMTRNWARRMGCYVDPKTEVHHGYFTIDEWREEFGKPEYMWRMVKRKIIELGEPLTFDEFSGHYWGLPGSQGYSVVSLMNRACTMIETAALHIGAMQTTSQWAECHEVINDGLTNGRHQLAITDLTKMMSSLGIETSKDFEQLLLISKEEASVDKPSKS